MRDAIAHPGWHAATTACAQALAARLGLRAVELPWPGFAVDAALTVVPPRLANWRAPHGPVVVVNRRSPSAPPGATVVCGVADEDDAAAAAIAGALARRLDLALLLVHVLPWPPVAGQGFGAPCGLVAVPDRWMEDERAAGRALLARVADAAGLWEPAATGLRLVRGTPGPALASMARQERAALVVAGAPSRRRVRRVFRGSATAHLVRRCPRPVVVCPADPTAAMRVREALSAGDRTARERDERR